MLLVDKYTNVLDDKIGSGHNTIVGEEVLTTWKVTKIDEVHKHTEKITTIQEVVKGTNEVHKRTEKIKTSDEVDKGSENWKI